MVIIEVAIICILAFTAGASTTKEVMEVVEPTPVEVVLQIPKSHFELALDNIKLTQIIDSLAEQRDRCLDRDI